MIKEIKTSSPPPESQLILLHVSVHSYVTLYICEKLVGTRGGGGGDIQQPKMY